MSSRGRLFAHRGSAPFVSNAWVVFTRVNMDMYGYGGVFLVKRFLDNDVFEVTNMSDINKANPHGCDNGALTDRFGVLIQGLLAIVAFSTLMCECPIDRFLVLKASSVSECCCVCSGRGRTKHEVQKVAFKGLHQSTWRFVDVCFRRASLVWHQTPLKNMPI